MSRRVDTSKLARYKTMPQWDYHSLPRGFRQPHNTKEGTWAKLTINSGSLQFDILTADGDICDSLVFNSHSDMPFIEPQQWHKVTPLTEDLECQLSFYCEPEDYYSKKYQLSKTHSEVVAVLEYIQSGTVLDFGCGRGRNSLFLQAKGFEVDAVDVSVEHIEVFNRIIEQEQLQHIFAEQGDIRGFEISKCYDLVLSTVVLMFIEAQYIGAIIEQMQKATKPGGLNVVVCAMDDPVIAAQNLPFKSALQEGELKRYYQSEGWEMLKYEEAPGELHRRDSSGNYIVLPFATMIARKPL